VKRLIRFLWDDLKSDIKFLKDVGSGKKNLDFSKLDWGVDWKATFMLFLFIMLSFCVGWFLASQYYQSECNLFILENYLDDKYVHLGDGVVVEKVNYSLGGSKVGSVFPEVNDYDKS